MTKEMFEEITAWQAQTFKTATAITAAEHLQEEAGELLEALKTYAPGKAIDHEYADCLLLIFGSAKLYGFSYEDICKLIMEKFKIAQNRKYGKPNDKGYVKHVDET